MKEEQRRDARATDRPGQERSRSVLPQPTLPKGGGAIAPIGEKLTTHPQTGTASFSFPILTTPGRNGFAPTLSLDYDSGGGNGPYGFGWSIGVPSIARKTERGLPRYPAFGAPDDDVFVLSGAEDLVPVSTPTLNAFGESVISYRPRVDSLFARIERRSRSDAPDYWVTISKNNVRSVYGYSAEARLSSPKDDSKVFRWFLEWTDDDRGSVIAYYYKQEDDAVLPATLLYESQRSAANVYLKAIGYLNSTPRKLEGRRQSPKRQTAISLGERLQQWPLVVLLDYGEHDLDEIKKGTLDVLHEADWSFRADPFSQHRSTFEIRTRRLCRNVLMLHRVTDEGAYDDSPDATHSIVARTWLEHDETPRASYLTRITQQRWRRVKPKGAYELDSFPTTELGYSKADSPDRTIHTLDRESADGLVSALDGTLASLVDFDGEGLPGILSEQAASWWYKRPNGPELPATEPSWHPRRWEAPRQIGLDPIS